MASEAHSTLEWKDEEVYVDTSQSLNSIEEKVDTSKSIPREIHQKHVVFRLSASGESGENEALKLSLDANLTCLVGPKATTSWV